MQTLDEWRLALNELEVPRKLRYYEKAIELSPQLASAGKNKAVALFALGEYDEAIIAMTKLSNWIH